MSTFRGERGVMRGVDRKAHGPQADRPHEEARLKAVYDSDYAHLVGLARWMVGSPGLAEELVQDTFVRLLERPPKLDDPEALSAYVRRAVVNRSRSRIRRLVLERKHARADVESIEEIDPDEAVRSAVAQLPIRQRQCVVLRFYADLTVDAIAETLGISAGSVKTHLHRANDSLKRLLHEGDRP